MAGEITYSESRHRARAARSWLRVTRCFPPKLTDNANVNLTKVGGQIHDDRDADLPVEFDADTLAPRRRRSHDPRGRLHNRYRTWRREGMLNYTAKQARGTATASCSPRPGRFEARGRRETSPTYTCGSFGLTERWLVLAEFPASTRWPHRVQRPRTYRWKPELGTRSICSNHGGRVGPFETEARFGFRRVNAYQRRRQLEIVVDVCTFPQRADRRDLYMDRLRAGKPVSEPSLRALPDRTVPGDRGPSSMIEEPMELPADQLRGPDTSSIAVRTF